MGKKKRLALLRSASPVGIRIFLSSLGGETRQLTFRSGARLKDLLKSVGVQRGIVRVNGRRVALSTPLHDRDLVTLLPESISGGARRYAHLNLEEYRKSMSPRDYDFFVRFIGSDAFGLEPEDVRSSRVP